MHAAETKPFRVLVFSKTKGYRHECIPTGSAMFRRLAADSSKASDQSTTSASTTDPFDVDCSEDAEASFTDDSLQQYRVLVFFQTSGDILDAEQLAALQKWVAAGRGGIVGIHCATSAMRDSAVDRSGWFSRLLGASFTEHPEPQLGAVVIKDRHHPVVEPLLRQLGPTETSVEEPEYSVFDEWYNFAPTSCSVQAACEHADNGIHLLLAADETTYNGGKHGKNHPIAWCQNFDDTGTRVFYTALGHFAVSYEEDENFVAHLNKAILWTAKVL